MNQHLYFIKCGRLFTFFPVYVFTIYQKITFIYSCVVGGKNGNHIFNR